MHWFRSKYFISTFSPPSHKKGTWAVKTMRTVTVTKHPFIYTLL
jgi:hypothetical protein